MADPKRTLNIPMYDLQDEPAGSSYQDDDVIDVEVISDGPSFSERLRERARGGADFVSEAVRNMKVNGAWDGFVTQPADRRRAAAGSNDPHLAAREAGRNRRRQEARMRAAQAADGRRMSAERSRLEGEALRDPLSQLKLDTIRAGESYMESLRSSGILGADATKDRQRQQLTGLHQVYASMMVLQCVAPLKQGLTAVNLVSTLGMAASMWALSPDFRTQLGQFRGKISDSIREKIEGREDRKNDKARAQFDKLVSKGKGDQLSARRRRRLDRIENAENGHRLPFTAESAAMTEVALAEAAYADMRRPGADRDAITARYQSARDLLYGFVAEDHLGKEEVSRAMRVIVGQRLEREPEMASVFAELGHGRLSKSEPREVYLPGTGEKRMVWTGDFVDSYEGRLVDAGSFSLRPPMSIDEHRVMSSQTLTAEMVTATTVEEMNDVLSQYVVAASVEQFPSVADDLDDPRARARFGKARTMFASMKADGLTSGESHFAYTAAYVDAVEKVQLLKPELASAWVAQYGDNWQQKVAEDLARYQTMGAGAAREGAEPEAPQAEHYAASSSERSNRSTTAEDIVDAEIVEDEDDRPSAGTRPTSDPRAPRPNGGGGAPRSPRTRSPRRLDQPVYEGEIDDEDDEVDAEIIDGVAYDVERVEPAKHRDAIEAAAKSIAPERDPGGKNAKRRRNAVARHLRARVNQGYNAVDTGRITGIGHDDATLLQDVDFELG
ncbi:MULTISPECIES: hypothetical protein [unclassified Microbacterium]|uniref:hypothetical protein n=1 Tax=unclassified Microbacterium TaxID=2609290 RepID=UPI002883535E|nr:MULTISPECIES: hypothetical protein [unclassified Microbacterium]